MFASMTQLEIRVLIPTPFSQKIPHFKTKWVGVCGSFRVFRTIWFDGFLPSSFHVMFLCTVKVILFLILHLLYNHLYSFVVNMQITIICVQKEIQLNLTFKAATWGVLKGKACGNPLTDEEHKTERTEGQIVYFSTSCIITYYQKKSVQKIRSPSGVLNDIHLPSYNFLFLNVAGNFGAIFFNPKSKAKPYPTR